MAAPVPSSSSPTDLSSEATAVSSSTTSKMSPKKDAAPPVSLPVDGVVRLLQLHGLLSILLEIPGNVIIVEEQLLQAVKGRAGADSLFATLRKVQRCPHPKYVKYCRLYSEWWFSAWTTTKEDVFATLKADMRRVASKKMDCETKWGEHPLFLTDDLPYQSFRKQDVGGGEKNSLERITNNSNAGRGGDAPPSPLKHHLLSGDRSSPSSPRAPGSKVGALTTEGATPKSVALYDKGATMGPAYKRRWSANTQSTMVFDVVFNNDDGAGQKSDSGHNNNNLFVDKSPRLQFRKAVPDSDATKSGLLVVPMPAR